MPSLTPTPTIAPSLATGPAPIKVNAQAPRTGRTSGATETGSSPFTEALKAAGDSGGRADSPLDASAEHDDLPGDSPAQTPEAAAEPGATTTGVASDEEPNEAPADTPVDAGTGAVNPPETPVNPDLEAQLVSEIDSGRIGIAPVEGSTPQTAAPQVIARPDQPTANAQTASEQPTAPLEPAPTAAAPINGSPAAAAPTAAPVASDATATAQPTVAETTTAATLAPAPTQPGATASTADATAPLDGQAIAAQAAADAETSAGNDPQQQQPEQRGAHPTTPNSALTTEQAEARAVSAPSDPSLAQALRDAAPDAATKSASPRVDPALIEAPTQSAQPSIGSIGAKPGAGAQQAAAPSLGHVEPDQAFTASVQRGLAAAVRQQGGTLTIKLDPPTLGKLTIKMTIDQGKVEATFDAQTAQARDLLLEHSTTLRAALRDKGLSVERLEVLGATSAGAGKASQSTGNTGEQQGAGTEDDQQQDAAGGQSRGRSETGEDESSRGDGINGDTAGTAGEPVTSPFEAKLRYSVSAVA